MIFINISINTNSNLSKPKRRIDWIDSAKGIGIILVVFSHLAFRDTQYSVDVVFSFHMPLFFFLSGIVFSNKDSFKIFLLKRIRSLYIPFLVFLTIDYFIYFIFNYDSLLITDFLITLVKQCIGYDLISDAYLFNGPIWFLCALFFSELCFYFITKLHNIFIVLSILAGIIGAYFIRFNLPFGIGYIFSSTIFLSLGFLSKDFLAKLADKINKYWCLAIFAVSIILVSFLTSLNEFISIRDFSYGNIALFLINSLLGTAGILALSVFLRNVEILKFFGQNSIVILCLHLYFNRRFIPFIFELSGIDNVYLKNIFVQLIIIVLIFTIMWFIIKFVNRYLYFIFGKRKTINSKNQPNIK
ncbi:MAG: acyltransferase family protein [Acutalibacteraceae bacterium]|nr:acyltransferase family protein [Acutalibacteraceae bacterium]